MNRDPLVVIWGDSHTDTAVPGTVAATATKGYVAYRGHDGGSSPATDGRIARPWCRLGTLCGVQSTGPAQPHRDDTRDRRREVLLANDNHRNLSGARVPASRLTVDSCLPS